MYRVRRNQYLSAAITEGDHEPEVDPYAFEEGDVKFTFSNKKDKAGGEREPGKKHKVRQVKWRSEEFFLVLPVEALRCLMYLTVKMLLCITN